MNVSISSRDNYCIDVVIRCLAIVGDGLGPHDLNDGGILSTIIAAGFKGSNITKLMDVINFVWLRSEREGCTYSSNLSFSL